MIIPVLIPLALFKCHFNTSTGVSCVLMSNPHLLRLNNKECVKPCSRTTSRMGSMETSYCVHTQRLHFQERDGKDQRKMQRQTSGVKRPEHVSSVMIYA